VGKRANPKPNRPKCTKVAETRTPSRRGILGVLSTATIAVGGFAAKKFAPDVLSHLTAIRIDRVVDRLLERHATAHRPKVSDRAHLFFLPSGHQFSCVVADDAPNLPTETKIGVVSTYRNEEHVVRYLQDLLSHSEHIEVLPQAYPVPSDHSLICVGSSIAHKFVRAVLGHPDGPLSFEYVPQGQGKRFKVPLRYSITKNPDVRVWRIQNGVPRWTDQHVIVRSDKAAIWPRHKPSSLELISDLLLVTKCPLETAGDDRDVIIYGGLHGPATRAVDMLFGNLSKDDLDFLEARVKGSPYYQAVFEITSLKMDNDTTKPQGIRLYRDESFEPVPLHWARA
jgi:hypothetical protein